ncbi:hypothetical protein JCM8097_003679 [Rhodosporidiobolus ruineniae]
MPAPRSSADLPPDRSTTLVAEQVAFSSSAANPPEPQPNPSALTPARSPRSRRKKASPHARHALRDPDTGNFVSRTRLDSLGFERSSLPPTAEDTSSSPLKFVLPLLPPSSTRSNHRQKRRRSSSHCRHDGDPAWSAWRALLGEPEDLSEEERKQRRRTELEKMALTGGKGALMSWGWWEGSPSESESEQDRNADMDGDLDLPFSPTSAGKPLFLPTSDRESSSPPPPEDAGSDFEPSPPPPAPSKRGRGRGRGKGRGGGTTRGKGRGGKSKGGGRGRGAVNPELVKTHQLRPRRGSDAQESVVDADDERDDQPEERDEATFPIPSLSPPPPSRPLSPRSLAAAFLSRPYVVSAQPWSAPPEIEGLQPFSPFPHLSTCALIPIDPTLARAGKIRPLVGTPPETSRSPVFPPAPPRPSPSPSSSSSPASPTLSLDFSTASPDTSFTSAALTASPEPISPRPVLSKRKHVHFALPKRTVPPPPPPLHAPSGSSRRASLPPDIPHVSEERESSPTTEELKRGRSPEDEIDVLEALLELRTPRREIVKREPKGWEDEWDSVGLSSPAGPGSSTGGRSSPSASPDPRFVPSATWLSSLASTSPPAPPPSRLPPNLPPRAPSTAAHFPPPPRPPPALPSSPPASAVASASALAFRPRLSTSSGPSSFRRSPASSGGRGFSSPSGSSASAASKAQALALASAQSGTGASAGGRGTPSAEMGEDGVKALEERLWGKGGDREGFPLDVLYYPDRLSVKLANLSSSDSSFSAPSALSLALSSSFLKLLTAHPKPPRHRLPALQPFPTLHTPPVLLRQFSDQRVALVLEYLFGRSLELGECAYLEKRERALWGYVRTMAAVAEVNERAKRAGGRGSSGGSGTQRPAWRSRG